MAGLLAPPAIAGGASGEASTGPHASCGTLWSEVPAPTPTVPAGGPALTGVAAVSPSDAWAVSGEGRVEHSDGGAWTLERFVAPGPLTGVSAVSQKDVWAVGYTAPGDQTLTAHWNGSAWSVVPSPNVGVGTNRLTAVDARGAHDVWAVGWYSNGAVYQTLIEHWNGSAWSVVASPNVGSVDNQLLGVTAIAGGDAWAVGSSGPRFGLSSTLAMHWDGTHWAVVATPDPGSTNALSDIDGTSAGDVWAVGEADTGSTETTLLLRWNGSAWEDHSSVSVHAPIAVVAIGSSDAWAAGRGGRVLHWNGTAWTDVSTPEQGVEALTGIAATSGSDVWAVGYSSTLAPTFGRAEHFDGMAWTSQPTPVTRYAHDGGLRAIAAVSPHNLWAVGDSRVQPDPLIEHWNGTAWSIVPGPSVGATASDLRSASATSASNVWAAGEADNRSLVEHFDGTSWSVDAVPNVGPIVAIAAISHGDVWAAGTAFFLHFDGTTWSSVPSPIAGMGGLAAISSDDVYAVGNGVAHFDGTSWTTVFTPPGSHALSVITASGPDDVWALGHGKQSFHFDGAAWRRIPIPSTPQMTGGSAVDPGEAWATGSGHHTGTVLRWDGTSWSTDLTAQRPAMLESIVALSSGDVWAVGVRPFPPRHPYVLHGTVCGDQAPVVTPPVASPQPGSSVTNDSLSHVTVQVTWAGSDADDSIVAYHLEESADGGSFAPVALPDPTHPAASIDTVLASTYVLRASATDSRGTTGDWATAASFEPVENQYPTERVGWRSRRDWDDWRSSDFYTGSPGAVALLRFHGRAIAWVGSVGPGYGAADVFIGGVHVASISQHSALSEHRLVLFSFVWPAYGRHAIRIVCRGTPGHPRTSIDGFVVLQ